MEDNVQELFENTIDEYVDELLDEDVDSIIEKMSVDIDHTGDHDSNAKKHGINLKHRSDGGTDATGKRKKLKKYLKKHYDSKSDAKELHPDVFKKKMKEDHDPLRAEDDAVTAVKKAENAGPKATQPKTKGGKTKAVTDKMKKMTSEEFDAFYEAVMEDTVGDKLEAEEIEANYDFTEDLDALVNSEATLSEEFKDKTAVIFEAAIKSKLSEEINRLEENYAQELTEATEEMLTTISEQVDGYLNLVVESWMKDNKIAVQSGLRTEIAESFMINLKDLFVENWVEVPESKVDLVDELSEQVAELEATLNETTDQAINDRAELEALKRNEIIRESAEGLADTQVEKLKSLTEDVDFDDVESFAKKVGIIKESYFTASKVTNTKTNVQGLTESVIVDDEGDNEDVVISENMSKYVSALKKSSK